MPEGLAPSFLNKPSIKQDAKTVTLQIDVAADPSPSIHWSKDGKELLNVDKIVTRMERKGGNQYTIYLDIKVRSFHPSFHHLFIGDVPRIWPHRIVVFTNVLYRMNWVQP